MLNFHQIVVLIGSIVLFTAFLLSLKIRDKKLNPISLNYFFLVPLFGMIITINTIFMNVLKVYGLEIGGLIERVLVMCDFLFWMYFFSTIGISIFAKRLNLVISSLVIGVAFITLSVNFITNRFHHYSITLFYIAEIVFCLIYLNKLFVTPPKLLLIKNPVFLIVTGLLIRCAVAIPAHLAAEIMFVGKNSRIYLFIIPIFNIAVLYMYGQFIYAFLCIKNLNVDELHFDSSIQKV